MSKAELVKFEDVNKKPAPKKTAPKPEAVDKGKSMFKKKGLKPADKVQAPAEDLVAKVYAYRDWLIMELLKFKSVPGKYTLSDKPGVLGQVIHGTKQVGVSKEALALLARVGRSRDDIGEIDCFKSSNGNLNFSWLGGGRKLVQVTPGSDLGSSSYVAPTESDVTVIPNDVPKEAQAAIDAR
jgi:hypothetical protein